MDQTDPGSELPILQWLQGTTEQRKAVFATAVQEYRAILEATLKKEFPALPWQDCEDFVQDAFVQLWFRFANGTFKWSGEGPLFAFLVTRARHDAQDYVRKLARRMGKREEIATREQSRQPISPLDALLQREADLLAKTCFDHVTEKLVECCRKMKPAQRSVAMVMVESLVNTARWPSNERLLEVLHTVEPGLKIGTLQDRRKEVLAKFKPILESSNFDNL